MDIRLTKNKTFESEIIPDPDFSTWLNITVKWDRKVDHAGLHIHLEVIGIMWLCSIHDNRHWNWEADRWYVSGEEEEEYRRENNDFRGSL